MEIWSDSRFQPSFLEAHEVTLSQLSCIPWFALRRVISYINGLFVCDLCQFFALQSSTHFPLDGCIISSPESFGNLLCDPWSQETWIIFPKLENPLKSQREFSVTDFHRRQHPWGKKTIEEVCLRKLVAKESWSIGQNILHTSCKL